MTGKCEACHTMCIGDLNGATRVRTTNGGLLLCPQCLSDINRKNPETAILREQLNKVLALTEECSQRRDAELEDAHAEAAKWKAEGDMYGWNFHEGRAGGMVQTDLLCFKIRRLIQEVAKAQPSN